MESAYGTERWILRSRRVDDNTPKRIKARTSRALMVGQCESRLVYAARRAAKAVGNWAIAWSIRTASASAEIPSAIT